MKRLLWLGVGLAIGALVVRAVTKKAQSYSPRGIASAARDSSRNLVDSVRDFVDDVREGMHEREQELRAGFTGELDDELADRLTDEDFDEVFGEPGEPGRPEGGRADDGKAAEDRAATR
jgi:hypothetical protein